MDFKKNIEEFSLFFLDVETTGLDAVLGDAICEIGVFKVERREAAGKFHTLINPQKPIPYDVYQIHKISNDDVKDAPNFLEIADKLLDFMGIVKEKSGYSQKYNSIICAYNAGFDSGFINSELLRINYPALEIPAIDVLAMARSTLRLGRYNLESIARFFNLDYPNSHRALDDAIMAYQVFCKLRDILVKKGLEKLDDYFSLYGLHNEIFKVKEEEKLVLVRVAIEQKRALKVRLFSYDNIMAESQIFPLLLISNDKAQKIIVCQRKNGENFNVPLNRILDIDKV